MSSINSKLSRWYKKYYTSISLDAFLEFEEKKDISFLSTLSNSSYSDIYVFFNIIDKETGEIAFIDKRIISVKNENFFPQVMQKKSKKGLTTFLETIVEPSQFEIHIFTIPKNDKKVAVKINSYFCDIVVNEHETNAMSNIVFRFIGTVEKHVTIQNISAINIFFFSVFFISAIVTLLIQGFPLSSITIESLAIVLQETLLLFGGLSILSIIFASIIHLTTLWYTQKSLNISSIFYCKKEFMYNVKNIVALAIFAMLVYVMITIITVFANYFRVTSNNFERPIFSNTFLDIITTSYIIESSLPSIQKVQIKDSNKSEIVLMMGIKDDVIYYYPNSLIHYIVNSELNGTSNDMCLKDKNVTYPLDVINLLNTGKLRHKKSERMGMEDMQLISSYNSFTKSFCDKNSTK